MEEAPALSSEPSPSFDAEIGVTSDAATPLSACMGGVSWVEALPPSSRELAGCAGCAGAGGGGGGGGAVVSAAGVSCGDGA